MATKIGSVVDGKFEILKKIGEGGMSFVYLAMDNRLNKQWAVKEIKKTANGENDQIVVNSLMAEANLMKKLDHPALPRIVDIIDSGSTIYVIMDYVEGESLDKILKSNDGPLPEKMVINCAMQICDALSYLHAQNPPIIYRDMKPGNVMLKPEGNIKVIDFGIAREYKDKKLADTKVMGTPGYASPEQHGSRQTDARSDIFSLGMTMHHLLTGIDPRTPGYVYTPVRQINSNLSEGIEEIINKCTKLEPQDRYKNCHELMYDLQNVDTIGEGIKQKNKNKLITFIASMGLSVAMLVLGVSSQLIAESQKQASYEEMVSELTNTASYDEQVENYLSAIDLDGTKVEAYKRLLEAYENSGQFTQKQSEEFGNVFKANKANIAKSTPEEIEAYLDLAYQSGMLHFYMYSDNDGKTNFRTSLFKAKSYFLEIVNFSQPDYNIESYGNYDIAKSYVDMEEFFTSYVDNSNGIKEPTKEDYDELLATFRTCMEMVDNFSASDAYNKLLMYEQIANLLNTNRASLAQTEVDEETVLTLLEEVSAKTAGLGVTQQKSVELQDSIVKNTKQYIEDIKTSYINEQKKKSMDVKESEETADD